MSHVIRTLAAAVCATALVALAPTAAPAAQSASDTQAYQSQVKSQVNEVRKHHGRVALAHDACIDRWANSWAEHLAGLGRLVHRPSTAGAVTSLRDIMVKCDLRWIGENLASTNSTNGATVVGKATDTVRSNPKNWMQSSGHRSNVMNSSARRTGVGAAVGAGGTIFVVELYGTPR